MMSNALSLLFPYHFILNSYNYYNDFCIDPSSGCYLFFYCIDIVIVIFIIYGSIQVILDLLWLKYYMIIIILLGFRYSASSTPIISSVGVAIGAGSTPSISIFAICRNPIIPNVLIRRALIGSPPVEVSGSIGSVYSFLVLYALYTNSSIVY